nr:wax ester/triacylglycerol synthase family O-acyltransferase [Actinomycetes bacterium]
MKRLSGWDAVLLYSETPTVHMHTLKLAVIQLDDVFSEGGGATFGVEQLRAVIQSRLYKLDPFRYELVEIPFKFHHPMWRENADVDLEYHVRPYRVDPPGGRRELDEAVGRIASTPLERSRPLWEMYLIEG